MRRKRSGCSGWDVLAAIQAAVVFCCWVVRVQGVVVGAGVLLPRYCRNWSAVNTKPPPTVGAGRGSLLCTPHHVKIHGGCQQDDGLETISGASSGCRRQT